MYILYHSSSNLDYCEENMVRFYELVLLVRQDSDVNRSLDALLNFPIEKKFEFKVVKNESWGIRKLAYTIDNEKHAHYVFLGLECDLEVLKELEARIKANIADFLRHVFVQVGSISDKRSPILDSDDEPRPSERPRPAASNY
jgi:small subunit ribosomal protein S6